MGKAHRFLWFILLLLMVSSVFAQTTTNNNDDKEPTVVVSKGLSPEDKAYFDGLNQKTVAQLSAKIDAQANAMETSLRSEVNLASQMIRAEVTEDMKGALKVIAFGLGGIIISVLAIFRIIEFKLSHTKKIQKYEAELEKQKKGFEEGLKALEKNKKEVKDLQNELMVYKKSLDTYAVSLGVQPQIQLQTAETSNQQSNLVAPKPKLKSKLKLFFTKKNIFRIILVLIMVALIIFFLNRYIMRSIFI